MDDTRARGGGENGSGVTRTVPCRYPLTEDGLCTTEVRISTRNDDKLKAFVTITLNEALVIRGIKVIEGRERLFVAMPSRPKPDGSFQDVVHPINQDVRRRLEGHVLEVYRELVESGDIH
jgi:stage V sporulation protein G